MNITERYDSDFYSWVIESSKLLRQKKFEELDIDNLIEEIESMGKSAKRELMTRFSILIAHLLKWKYQPQRQSNSWKLTIKNQRFDLHDLLNDNPSLKPIIESQFMHAYEKSLILASGETGLAEHDFPKNPPFTIAECLNNNFLPE